MLRGLNSAPPPTSRASATRHWTRARTGLRPPRISEITRGQSPDPEQRTQGAESLTDAFSLPTAPPASTTSSSSHAEDSSPACPQPLAAPSRRRKRCRGLFLPSVTKHAAVPEDLP